MQPSGTNTLRDARMWKRTCTDMHGSWLPAPLVAHRSPVCLAHAPECISSRLIARCAWCLSVLYVPAASQVSPVANGVMIIWP